MTVMASIWPKTRSSVPCDNAEVTPLITMVALARSSTSSEYVEDQSEKRPEAAITRAVRALPNSAIQGVT